MSRTPHGHRDGRLHRRFSLSILRLESRELLTATIADPSFESVVVGSGNFGYAYNPANSPWTFTANSGNNGSGVSGNGSAFTSGNPAAPDGNQVAFIQSFGRISQSISGWDAGTYQISLQAAQRGGYNLYENFQVLLDGTVITTFDPSDATYRTYTTPIFQVTAGIHTLSFQGTNSAQSDNTALIDAVSLAPVTTTAPVVNDPGFESFAVGNGGYIYNPGGSAWTFSMESGVSGSGVSANGSPFTNKSPNAPEGVQAAFLQQVGTITQSIAGWNPGSYQISFQAVQRTNYQTSSEDFQVYLDNTVIGTFIPLSTSYQIYTTDSFPVTAGTHTISFQGLDSATGDNTAFIDDVNVTTITSSDTTPVAPSYLTATTVGSSEIDLAWPASDGATGYSLERSLDGVNSWAAVAALGADASSYTDTGVAAETHYDYRILAIGHLGDSGYSETADARTRPTPSTFTSADPPPPIVQIYGPHSGTTMPNYIQGMAYSLNWTDYSRDQPSQDPNYFTGYTYDGVQESFPSGAIKGFGTFRVENSDPRGPHTVFNGGPSAADGVNVQAVTSFTDEDTSVTNPGVPGQFDINTFYFGPEAQGVQNIGVDLKFKKYIAGKFQGEVTIGDTVQVNVLKPSGQITVTAKGTPGVSGIQGGVGGSQVLQLSKSWDTIKGSSPNTSTVDKVDLPNPGIRWDASVTLPNNQTTGSFGIFQTVSTNWVRKFDTKRLSGKRGHA